jgi:cupin 2 domain-containing protein
MEIMGNLLDTSGMDLTNEVFEQLHASGGTLVERIVSNGQQTQWFDQEHDEWVMVLRGGARLEYRDGTTVDLEQGQATVLPAHLIHRVVWTQQPTVWLAVHFPAQA